MKQKLSIILILVVIPVLTNAYTISNDYFSSIGGYWPGSRYTVVIGNMRPYARPNLPDLAITGLSGPNTGNIGQSISILNTVQNRGSSIVGASSIELYLSDNPLVETDQDIFLGRRDVFGLDIGASSKATVSVTIPQYTPSGAYYIGGIVDPDYFIDEEDESNNTRIAAAKIQIGSPTRPPVASFTADPTSGTSPLPVQFADQSTGSITSWSWDFGDGDTSKEQNPSHTYDTPGKITVALTVSGAGGTDTETRRDYITVRSSVSKFTLNVRRQGTGSGRVTSSPAGINCGQDCSEAYDSGQAVTLTAAPDAGSMFAGWSGASCTDTDQCTVTIKRDMTITGKFRKNAPEDTADLIITGVTGPTTAVTGAPIRITDTVKNQGTKDVYAFTIGLYLSEDRVVDPEKDLLIGTRTRTDLAMGQTSKGASTVTIPNTVESGSYYIGAYADIDNVIDEASEANNARTDRNSVRVTAQKPDLTITEVNGPVSAKTGKPIDIIVGVKNEGSAASGEFIVEIYLSTDPKLQAADILLGDFRLAKLNRSQTIRTTVRLNVPSDLTPGSYYIIAFADSQDAIGELDEDNNVLGTLRSVSFSK